VIVLDRPHLDHTADQDDDWRRHAPCLGLVAVFYGGAYAESTALAICSTCTVRTECLAETLAEERDAVGCYGVRGGLTADERRARLA
jgi:hypothetical protein